jgi:hypothetical protein
MFQVNTLKGYDPDQTDPRRESPPVAARTRGMSCREGSSIENESTDSLMPRRYPCRTGGSRRGSLSPTSATKQVLPAPAAEMVGECLSRVMDGGDWAPIHKRWIIALDDDHSSTINSQSSLPSIARAVSWALRFKPIKVLCGAFHIPLPNPPVGSERR